MIQHTQSKELSKPISKPVAIARRVDYVDIAKGIGITLVVMGHADAYPKPCMGMGII